MKLFTQIPVNMTKKAEVGIKAIGVGDTGSAEKMEREGRSREDIWNETGWYRGVDGKWRFEIDDGKSKLRLGLFSKYKFSTSPNIRRSFEGRLGDVLVHPHIFNAYPELRDWKVDISFDVGPDTWGYVDHHTGLVGRASGLTDPATMSIRVSSGLGVEPTIRTLIHEMQHVIQEIEDFSQGGNPGNFRRDRNIPLSESTRENIKSIDEEIADLKKEEDSISEYFRALPDSKKGVGKNVDETRRMNTLRYRIQELKDKKQCVQKTDKKKYCFDKYLSLPGEMEARLVQRRLDMNRKQRKDEPPWVTMDKMLQDENISPTGKTT